MRKMLTDTFIKSRKAAPEGKRFEVMDLGHHRLMLRVTDSGHKSFQYLGRFPGSIHPTRRRLGDYPTMTLEDAREEAREFDKLLAKGIDPRDEKLRLQREQDEVRRQGLENIFELRVREYLSTYCRGHRQIGETTRLVERELLPEWRTRTINSITTRDVHDVVSRVVKRSPSVGRNVLSLCKSFFAWAADIGREYVATSPAASISYKRIIGKRPPRERVLDDAEVIAFWRATERLEYPVKHFFRVVLLTGTRRDEAAGMEWREVSGTTWTIPPARFKSECSHTVPLTAPVIQLLDECRRFDDDAVYVFSTTKGLCGLSGSFSRWKADLDKLMEKELGRPIERWQIHDLRRVCRSRLAQLKVPPHVAERCIGHGPKGVVRVYDRYEYADEIREAMTEYANHVLELVTPRPEPSDKVVRLKSA